MGQSQSKFDTYEEGKEYCLNFNNRKFTNFLSRGRDEKASSHNNAAAIKTTFQACGFKVETVTDCTTTNTTRTLERLKTCKGRNSLVIFFLSQGYSDGTYDDGGLCLSYADILSHLTAANCPTFSDKPKIIFFPNCQMGEGAESGKGAIEDDFLIAFGTQSILDEMKRAPPNLGEKGDTKDLLFMLTNVTRNLQTERDAVKPGLTQTPVILTGDVYLKRSHHKRLRDINCPLQSDSYCFIPSVNLTRPLEMHIQAMHNYNNYQQNNTGASQARSALESVVKEPVISENISCNGSLGRASSSNTRSENLEANTKEPMEIQEHINTSEQPLPVYIASAASKSVEKYQCNTVAIEVSEAAAEKERSHSGISKATKPLTANGVVEPNKTQDSIDTSEFFSDEQRFDHEVLSPTLLWDDIETPNGTEGEKKEGEKEEEEEQLQDSTTVLHKLLVQGNENEITIQTETMEETQPKSRTLSDETEVPELILKKSNQHQSDETEYNEDKSKGIFGDLTRLTVTSAGLTHHCSQYGVTLVIPEGAVQQPANVWFGACLYGDKLNFGKYVPVTPIVRVHVDTELKKPAELYLPHHVDDTDPVTRSKLTLLTANDDSNCFIPENKKIVAEHGLCRISCDHFCSSCVVIDMIEDNNVTKEYIMVRAEKKESNAMSVHFCIFPLQIACKKLVEKQFSMLNFEIKDFEQVALNAGEGVTVTFDPDETAGWKRTAKGTNKISEENANYLEVMKCKGKPVTRDGLDRLKMLEDMFLYPPRFRFEFSCTNASQAQPKAGVTATFTGQLSPLQFRIPLSIDETMSLVPATGWTSPNSFSPSEHKITLAKILSIVVSGFKKESDDKWHPFGLALGFDLHQLKTIENIEHTHNYVRAVLELRYQDQTITWEPVAKALKVIQLKKLAKELEHSFQEPDDDTMPAELNTSKLSIKDLNYIIEALEKVLFSANKWEELGLKLGLYQPTLNSISGSDNKKCLRKTIELWLECQDAVNDKGGPTWENLMQGIKNTGNKAASENLRNLGTLKHYKEN